jgi:hypothetical protein
MIFEHGKCHNGAKSHSEPDGFAKADTGAERLDLDTNRRVTRIRYPSRSLRREHDGKV